MDSVTINDIVTFDNVTGLKISSKGEILEDLKNMTKIAYGTDYAIEQGNEYYSFLDLLAGSLSDIAGAIQKVYNTLSFTGASGTNLDNVVSFVGITRKAKTNSKVLIKATIDSTIETIERPLTFQAGEIVLEDSEGNKWINIESLYIAQYKITGGTEVENYVGTAMFEASDLNTDPTNIILEPYNNGTNNNLTIITSTLTTGISFINEVGSELGNQEETDAQLRARYKKELYRESVGTIEGLIAQIEETANVDYCYIIENSTSTTSASGMTPHSIWVITNGTSTWDGSNTSTDPDDIKIAQAILNYKSLGCATSIPTSYQSYDSTSGEGQISVNITIDSTEYNVKFYRAKKVDCVIELDLDTSLSTGAQRDSIEYQIKQNIINYVNKLGIGNDVLNSGVFSSVFSVITNNEYADFVIDITDSDLHTVTETTAGKRISIDVNQYANITEENITINWTTI